MIYHDFINNPVGCVIVGGLVRLLRFDNRWAGTCGENVVFDVTLSATLVPLVDKIVLLSADLIPLGHAFVPL